MAATWFFNSPTPGRTRESQVEKFFKAEGERADAIVREGIQNSLDAGNDNSIVRIRLTLGRWTSSVTANKWPRYGSGLDTHLMSVADELADPPSTGEAFRFLAFEDFETSGLEGPPEQWLVDKQKKILSSISSGPRGSPIRKAATAVAMASASSSSWVPAAFAPSSA